MPVHRSTALLAMQAILCAGLWTAPGLAAQIEVGVEVHYPPFEEVNPVTGAPQGFAVDLIRAVGRVTGLDPVLTVGPWNQMLEGLRTGRFDVLPFVAISPDRERDLAFSVPIVTSHGAVFVRKGGPVLRPAAALEDRLLGVMHDDVAHEFLLHQPWARRIMQFDTLDRAFRGLAAGEVDAVVAPRLSGLLSLKHTGIDTVRALDQALEGFVLRYAFAVRKGNDALLAQLNGGLAILHADGSFDRIYDQWLPSGPERGVPLEVVLRYSGLAGFAFALIISLMYLRQWHLARRAERAAALDRSFEALSNHLLSHVALSINDIAMIVLDEGKRLTASRFGFVGQIDTESGNLICPAFSRDVADGCAILERPLVFHHYRGLWGWVLEHRQPLLCNDPSSDTRAWGTPVGHVPIVRFVAAPAILGDQLVGIIALANAGPAYDRQDILIAQRLAMVFALSVRRKQLELALDAEKQRAEAANRTKSLFLAQMSHELRTPLNAIIGFSELLGWNGADGDTTRPEVAYATYIRSAGVVLLGILNDILLLSEAESGRISLQKSWIDLHGLIDELVLLFHEEARHQEITLAADLPDRTFKVRADQEALRRIIFNLLHNAVKYTPAAGRVTVAAVLTEEGGMELSIQDTGVGIAPDRLAAVLEPFDQMDELYRRRKSGVGLGLAIVTKLVQLHDATMVIESAPSLGTTVRITLGRDDIYCPMPALSCPA